MNATCCLCGTGPIGHLEEIAEVIRVCRKQNVTELLEISNKIFVNHDQTACQEAEEDKAKNCTLGKGPRPKKEELPQL